MKSRRVSMALSIAAGCVIALLAAQSAQSQTYKVLYTFSGGADGTTPNAVIEDAEGNLYGTTSAGGGSSVCNGGCGTVFKLSKTGKETVLYRFKGAADGASPYAGVIRDAQGNLYGTTGAGGGSSACNGGCGTVFKLTESGRETVLYRFTGAADGASPAGELIRDAEENLYGTAAAGGEFACPGGCGTVFKLSKARKETVLYSFKGGADGWEPDTGVIQDSEGSLYGTTFAGGDLSCGYDRVGCGTLFKLSKTGNETVLHSFRGGPGGANPNAGMMQDAHGTLYGTTYDGGSPACNPGCGTVFKLSAKRRETVLYRFKGGSHGQWPEGRFVRDAEGNLYGATYDGGNLSCGFGPGCGTIFKLRKTGKKTVLHTFCSADNCSDGVQPTSGVIQDAKGSLYGTTAYGGDLGCQDIGCGVVFKLTP